jgi:hypothetical protein
LPEVKVKIEVMVKVIKVKVKGKGKPLPEVALPHPSREQKRLMSANPNVHSTCIRCLEVDISACP